MSQFSEEQETLIKLIKEVFQVSERIQKGVKYLDFHGANTTQDTVANTLGIDASQFGKMLKPGYTYTLSKYINQLELLKQLGSQKNRRIINLESQIRMLKVAFFTCLFLAILMSLTASYFAFSQPNEEPEFSTQGYVVQSNDELRAILNWYGSNINRQLVILSLEANKNYRSNGVKNYDAEINKIVRVIREERNKLYALGFVNSEGENIVKLIRMATPDKLIEQYSRQAITEYIYQDTLSFSQIKDGIFTVSTNAQDQVSWPRIEELIDSLKYFKTASNSFLN